MATLIKITGLQASVANSQTYSVSRGFRVPISGTETAILPGTIYQVDIDNPQVRKRLSRNFKNFLEVPGNDLTHVVLRSLLLPSAADVSQSFVSRGTWFPTQGYGFVGGSQARATFTTAGPANSNITYSAVNNGAAGNAVTVDYVVAGASTPLSVAVVGNAITVNVATNGSSVATSTGSQVLAAVQASAPASALVTAALATGNSGAGVVAAFSATNLAGGVDYDQDLTQGGAVTIDLTNPNARRAVRLHRSRLISANTGNTLVTVRGILTSSSVPGGGLSGRGFRINKWGQTGTSSGTSNVAVVTPTTNVQVDLSDWNVRRTLRRNIGRFVVVSSP